MSTIVSQRPRRLAIFAFAGIVFLLMLPNLLWVWFSYGDINVWVQAAILPSLLLLVVFALFGDVLWLACLLMIPFTIMVPMEAFYVGSYHHPTYPEIFATLFASNPREIREYLGDALVPLIACVTAVTIFAILTGWWVWRARLRWCHPSRIWTLVIAIATLLIVGATTAATASGDLNARFGQGSQIIASLADPIEKGYPFGLFQRYAEYHQGWAAMRVDLARMKGFSFRASRLPGSHRRQVYVLVIGEASRRDHWQLFGYGRATNPELSHIANLVPISDMDSSWPQSINAIPMIITRKPQTMKSMDWREASILRAMQESGYDTWWISNQMPIGVYDSPVSVYAYEANHVLFRNHVAWSTPGTYDDDLLLPLRQALRSSNQDLFIVLHLMGSHQRYDYRYPTSFKRFRPTELGTAAGSSMVERSTNSYDNSILFTDHILASVIGILKDSDATTALWYESDHGESLPTANCSLTGHGNGTRYEYEISALFWASNEYVSAFPQRYQVLRANAGKRTMSADTFESLIDMTNTTYPKRDPTRSMFDEDWKYRPRTINFPWQVNIDDADFSKNCQMALPKNG